MSESVENSTDEGLQSKLKNIEAKIKALDVKKRAIQNEFSKRSIFNPPKKAVLIGALLVIILFAVLLRTMHLFDTSYYYIIGSNSFLYNRMAELIISGRSPLPIPEATSITSIGGSGLAYPLAYSAYVLAFIFQTTTMNGLVLAGEVLPIALTVVTLLLVYFMVSKTTNWTIGIVSVFAMAVIPSIYLIQAAGYLDNDALSLLLVMIGVSAYYFLRKWNFKRGNHDFGWIIGAIFILGIEGLLFLEWNFGSFVMIAIISGCFILEFIGYFLQGITKGYSLRVLTLLLRDAEFISDGLKKVPNKFSMAIKRTNWKLFILIIFINILIAVLIPDAFSLGANIMLQNYSIVIANVFVDYTVLLIPLFLGFLATLVRRREGDIFWLGWFFAMAILNFFDLKLIIFMAPAAAVLIARSLAPIVRFKSLGRKAKTALTLFMVIALFFSIAAYDLAAAQGSPNSWNQALTWCNQNTQANATILTYSGNAYWVIDIAHRTPVFGYSGLNTNQTRDLALAYCTNDTNTTIQIMNKYGASYLIFSKYEVAALPQLTKLALGQSYGNGISVPDNMKNSVYYRIVFGNFSSEDGLTKVYWTPQNQQEVVVLELDNT